MSAVVGGDVSEGDELRRVKLEKKEEVPAIKSDVSTESSSSIGQPDDDSDDEDEVESTLSSLASLEDSLPIKRGLSKFYGGKSKSFGNLGEVKSLKEIGKADNPFNKRRRTLMAYNLMFNKDYKNLNESNNKSIKKNNKSGLFYAHSNPISMPLLPLAEDDDDGDDGNNIYGSSSTFLGSRGFHRFEEKKSHPSIDDHHISVNAVSSSSRLDVYSSVK